MPSACSNPSSKMPVLPCRCRSGCGLGFGNRFSTRAPWRGARGVLHGTGPMLMEDDAGRIIENPLGVSGLDLPRRRPGNSWLARSRPGYLVNATDEEALTAFS